MLLLGLLSPFSPSFGPLLPGSLLAGDDEGGGIVTWEGKSQISVYHIPMEYIFAPYLQIKIQLSLHLDNLIPNRRNSSNATYDS